MKNLFTKLMAAITLGGGLFILAQACTETEGKGSTIPKNAEPIPVKVISVEKSDSEPVVMTSGRLTTDDEAILGFKTGGVVKAVYVDEGDKIVKGQILATLDFTEINSLVAQAKSGLEKAERDLQRVKNLYTDSVATLEQLQNAETGYEIAKQQYNAANFNRNYSEIKAPASGFVLRKFVNPGQVVGTGDAVLRTNGAGNGKFILRSGVSDKQWSAIKINDKAIVNIDAFPEKEFKGVVIRKSESADPATGAFTIEIALDNESRKLASGIFASAQIVVSDKISSWNVPYEAVLDANDNEGFVFVTNDDKKAIKKAVAIESFNGNHIKVSRGLEGAKSIIISGSAYLTDNSPIIITK
jgi:RND family efflux transporter MFP subunit